MMVLSTVMVLRTIEVRLSHINIPSLFTKRQTKLTFVPIETIYRRQYKCDSKKQNLRTAENTVGKGENVTYQNVFLFSLSLSLRIICIRFFMQEVQASAFCKRGLM